MTWMKFSSLLLPFWSTLATLSIALCTVQPPQVARAAGALQALGSSSALRQCGGPAQLQWSGGVGQMEVAVIDGDGRLVRSFDRQPQDTTSVTWYPVNATSGSQLYLVVHDESGQTAQSAVMLVGDGGDSSFCSPVVDPALPSFTLFSGASILPSQTDQTGTATATATASTGGSTSVAASITSASDTMMTTSMTSNAFTTLPSSTTPFVTSTSAPASQSNGSQHHPFARGRCLDWMVVLSAVLLIGSPAMWYAV